MKQEKNKCKALDKSAVTIQKEYRQLQIYVCRIVTTIGYSEWAILIFESIYLAIMSYFEYIAILVVVFVVILCLIKQLWNIQRLLKFEEDCKNCKQYSICTICHCCQNASNHNSLLQMCLDEPLIHLMNKLLCVFVVKIVLSLVYQAYTAVIITNSMKLHTLLEATIIAVLFVNSIFLLLLGIFWKKFSDAVRYKNVPRAPSNGFQYVDKSDQVIEDGQMKTGQKPEQKNPTPEQQELEDKGSVNISINENISPAMLKLKSSLTPSPGKYRSGKILDFLEKKLSHVRASQKDISGGASKEFTKKYNTDQGSISVDFGDVEDQSNRHKIEKEINNHNFLQQTKFLS